MKQKLKQFVKRFEERFPKLTLELRRVVFGLAVIGQIATVLTTICAVIVTAALLVYYAPWVGAVLLIIGLALWIGHEEML